MKSPVGVRALRQGLGLTQQELANLLSVSESNVRRWELEPGANIGRQSRLLLIALQEVCAQKTEQECSVFGHHLRHILMQHGGLQAMYVVLSELYDGGAAMSMLMQRR